MDDGERISMKGDTPESWHCIDCGVDTAPGFLGRADMEDAIAASRARGEWENGPGVTQTIDDRSEVYLVRARIWERAGMKADGGCLCIGCVEKRLGRRLRPKDFQRGHPFNDNDYPGTPRLLDRRGRR
jgi:hypothetical protein